MMVYREFRIAFLNHTLDNLCRGMALFTDFLENNLIYGSSFFTVWLHEFDRSVCARRAIARNRYEGDTHAVSLIG